MAWFDASRVIQDIVWYVSDMNHSTGFDFKSILLYLDSLRILIIVVVGHNLSIHAIESDHGVA